MLIKIVLTGGPFDGQTLQSDGLPPQFIVPILHPDKPIYGCTICQCCAEDAEELEYSFRGYDSSVRQGLKSKGKSESVVRHN
ncbi:MAG: hypothetical protein EKK48_29500 [Candidatus Melainabacteria bacterium]|nr:MAG: hypothetical protein EKK48_29500 [Candidatus Melainabacteria bacterium]